MSLSPAAPAHPLDNVVWSALTTRQSALAEGDGLARRFDVAFARFGALAEPSATAMAALARLVPAGEMVALVLRADIDPGPEFELLGRRDLVQMVGPAQGVAEDPDRFVVLDEGDAPRIQDLVKRTEPGPFYERTQELGRFIGLEVDGRLVAMAGERMRVDGHTEISAVCTDPAWRGKGLARDLVVAASQAIVARGEIPFLHVLGDNMSALALYRKLGFTQRVSSRLALLQRR